MTEILLGFLVGNLTGATLATIAALRAIQETRRDG